jgi:toxin ParE1/3/4
MASKRSALWSPEALADIELIWDYYAENAGAATADRLLRGIDDAVSRLDEYPLLGRSRDDVRSGLRSILSGPHVIFYRVVEHRAEIVRVLDGRRDIDEIFGGAT